MPGKKKVSLLGAGSTRSRAHGDLEMVLWDEAWSGAKDRDGEGGIPALNCVMRKAAFQVRVSAILFCD